MFEGRLKEKYFTRLGVQRVASGSSILFRPSHFSHCAVSHEFNLLGSLGHSGVHNSRSLLFSVRVQRYCPWFSTIALFEARPLHRVLVLIRLQCRNIDIASRELFTA